MRIAILGATSQIAKDLILSFATKSQHEIHLYARRPDVVSQWLAHEGLAGCYAAFTFAEFTEKNHFDAILNCVGVGDPARAIAMGSSIFDVTMEYDEMALNYVHRHPNCRYIFLSSGAAYGSVFVMPAEANTKSTIDINNLQPQDWYGVAKLYAESRHRALSHFSIVDIRIFNYFSRSHNIESRFLISDVLRALRDDAMLKTSAEKVVRDFLHPTDFHQLVDALLFGPATNIAVDCYTLAPVDKMDLLNAMQQKFGLRYEISNEFFDVNGTGTKQHYYSLNRRAAELGYKPQFTALETVLLEAQCILNL